MEIKFLDKELSEFKPATELSGGYDLRSMIDINLRPGETERIPTGISVYMAGGNTGLIIHDQKKEDPVLIPCAIIMPRSGLGCKGIRPRNTPGLIDADYQGEIVVCLYNGSSDFFEVKRMDRIAQLVFTFSIHPEFMVVDEFTNQTKRGDGGFGSTGKS